MFQERSERGLLELHFVCLNRCAVVDEPGPTREDMPFVAPLLGIASMIGSANWLGRASEVTHVRIDSRHHQHNEYRPNSGET